MSAATHELRLRRHDLDDGPVRLPPLVRVLYVVEGEILLTAEADWPDRLAQNTAASGTAAVSIAPTDVPSVVLSFEVVPAGHPADGPVERASELQLDPDAEHLLRCDRVDFPPGGVALLHTHQGPGTRVLLQGTLRVEVDGDATTIVPLGSWFERGPDAVHATASATEPTAFVRVMVLPRSLLGSPSIRYVRDEDRDVPKSQRYTMFVDEPLELPRSAAP